MLKASNTIGSMLAKNPFLRHTLIGSGVGGVGGAIMAKPGKRLQGAALGAGLGAGLGAVTGSVARHNADIIKGLNRNFSQFEKTL
jgi:hypothetical protein